MYQIPILPISFEIETKAVLKRATAAHRYLAELKGIAATIPNQGILLNSLTLQEAKDSSAIENIITTHDELFKADLFLNYVTSSETKEVQRYAQALRRGFELIKNRNILTLANILEIQAVLEQNNAGLRKTLGTVLKNQRTGAVVYTPPQHYDEIYALMQNLIDFINDDEMSDVDNLIKMAIIHHQFESIHPFYDGNGRTGRIINILYLVMKDLLNIPILYLSRFIIENKTEYYELLQQVRDQNDWEKWLCYMLKGIEQTAAQTIKLVQEIKSLMQQFKQRLRSELPKIYSQDLLNNLFKHPYTKIDFLAQDLGVSRQTAIRYLKSLEQKNFIESLKVGRNIYYINRPLYDLLSNPPLS